MKEDNLWYRGLQRYVLYAKVQGLSPETVFLRDKELYPGDVMCGFMLWMARRKKELEQENPSALTTNGHIYDHVAYDEFLKRRSKELIEKGDLG
jgi:hypothetical protein